MKKVFLTSSLLVLSFFVFFAAAQEKTGAKLSYAKEYEDLGELFVQELEPMKLEIEFTNEGDEPLIISTVRGCCGTRVKDYPKQPILPGEKGIIHVEFRLAPRPHKISRTVSVMSNDADGMKVYRIRGEVVDTDPSAFENKINPTAGPRTN
ncbi:MAG: DUF1573 domain-containing protein [Bacteroidota bacterium]